MKTIKALITIFLCLLFLSCGSNSGQKKSDFKIITNDKKGIIKNNETLSIKIDNLKNHSIDSIFYFLDNKTVSENVSLKNFKLGKHTIQATVYYNDEQQSTSKNITILNSDTPKVYTFNILNEYPHDITSYTQGLEFNNGDLYESTGQYSKSKLRQINYKTGKVINNIDLANEYFGEGLTILDNNIYQLTWKRGLGFVYDLNTFKKTSSFKYGNSKEGWGLCNDGNSIYKSDGTEKIWLLNKNTLAEENAIQVYTNKGKIVGLNELEWVDGKIYANRYQKNGVAIINPKNGAIEGVIDFTALKNKVKQHDELDVLNGIAYNPETKTLFVTGKHWDKLFEIEIIEK